MKVAGLKNGRNGPLADAKVERIRMEAAKIEIRNQEHLLSAHVFGKRRFVFASQQEQVAFPQEGAKRFVGFLAQPFLCDVEIGALHLPLGKNRLQTGSVRGGRAVADDERLHQKPRLFTISSSSQMTVSSVSEKSGDAGRDGAGALSSP